MLLLPLLLQSAVPAESPPPRWLNRGAIGFKDYPQESLRRGDTGIVSVLLLVTPAGQVGQCFVTESSGSHVLDSETCHLLTRKARFEPLAGGDATGADRRFRTALAWGVDSDQPSASMDFSLPVAKIPGSYQAPLKLQVEFDGAGTAAECAAAEGSTDNPALVAATCRAVVGHIAIAPPVTASAEPARAVRWVHLTLTTQAGPK